MLKNMLDLNVDAVSVDSACDETDPLPKPKSPTAAHGGFLADDYSGASSSVVNNATALVGDEESNSSSGTRMTTLKFSILNAANVNHIIRIVDDDDDEDEDDDGNDQELLTRQLFPAPKTESFPLTTAQPQQWLKLSVPEVGGGGIEMGFCNKVGLLHQQQQQVAVGQANQQQAKKSRRGPRSRSSQYRGVTFYRRTGRWESHIWFVFFPFIYLCLSG